MKFGACGIVSSEGYSLAKKMGFDYFETAVRVYFDMSEEDFQKDLERVKEIGLPVLCANGLFYGSTLLFGENATPREQIEEMIDIGFSRISRLGVKKVVWGSGASRVAHEGMTEKEIEEGLTYFADLFADYAKKYGMIVVIEPLCRYETNVFNTVKSSYEFAKKLNRPEMQVLADSYHMMVECEKYDTLNNYGDMLTHAHIAEAAYNRKDIRRTPDLEDEFNVKEFVYELKKAGYDGTLSIEAGLRTGDWKKDMTDALSAVKEWAK
jgi:sugar phosphate isomerase/epimerase